MGREGPPNLSDYGSNSRPVPDPPDGTRMTTTTTTTSASIRKFGLLNGIAIVLGLQIGSGIFASPSLVARNAGSPLAALIIWGLGGLVAWICAACYIELGIRMPFNGGPQYYLAFCFNDTIGFLASWACIFAVMPCSAAVLALVIADYLTAAIGTADGLYQLVSKLIALAVLAVVTIINCIGNKASSGVTNFFLLCKITGIGFVIIMGFATLVTSHQPSSTSSTVPLPSVKHDIGSLTDATLSAMWAYSGWETVCNLSPFVAFDTRLMSDNS